MSIKTWLAQTLLGPRPVPAPAPEMWDGRSAEDKPYRYEGGVVVAETELNGWQNAIEIREHKVFSPTWEPLSVFSVHHMLWSTIDRDLAGTYDVAHKVARQKYAYVPREENPTPPQRDERGMLRERQILGVHGGGEIEKGLYEVKDLLLKGGFLNGQDAAAFARQHGHKPDSGMTR